MMEIVFYGFAILVVLALSAWVIQAIKSIKWFWVFGVFILGAIPLAVLFNFTSENVWVIIGAYAVLLAFSVVFIAFKSLPKSK